MTNRPKSELRGLMLGVGLMGLAIPTGIAAIGIPLIAQASREANRHQQYLDSLVTVTGEVRSSEPFTTSYEISGGLFTENQARQLHHQRIQLQDGPQERTFIVTGNLSPNLGDRIQATYVPINNGASDCQIRAVAQNREPYRCFTTTSTVTYPAEGIVTQWQPKN